MLGEPAFDPEQGTWAELTAELRTMREPTALVSCEGLGHGLWHREHLERFVRAAEASGRSLTLFAVVREPIGWLNSTYQQNVRDFAVTESFDEFRDRLHRERATDYDAMFHLAAEDPRIELVVMSHEEIKTEAPLSYLARAVALDRSLGDAMSIVEGRENPSVGPITVEVARLVGSAVQARIPGFSSAHPLYRPLRRTFRERAESAGWNAEPYWGWSEESRQATLETMGPSLDAFAQRVWKTSWTSSSPQRARNVANLSFLEPEEAARVVDVLAEVHQLLLGASPTEDPLLSARDDPPKRRGVGWLRSLRGGHR